MLKLSQSALFVAIITVQFLFFCACNKNEVTHGEGERGEFPVALIEANFYQESPDAINIEFNVDWKNTSGNSIITYVLFGITAKDAQGNELLTQDGEKTLFFRALEDGVISSQYNNNYRFSFYDESFSNATVFNIYVAKAQDSDGVLWENNDGQNSIEAIFLGKKGFSFDQEIIQPDYIKKFIEYFSEVNQTNECKRKIG